jgi:hypothetical protein
MNASLSLLFSFRYKPATDKPKKPQATPDYHARPKMRVVRVDKYLSFENTNATRNRAITRVKDVSTQEIFNVYEGQLCYCESGNAYLVNGENR